MDTKTPIVKIVEGQVKGRVREDYRGGPYYSFQGIPYAKPPIGPLRFKAPEPCEPWDDVLDATKPGAECPANHMFFGYYIGSEDNCLNLNVYTKSLPGENARPKPVMVWIHGGAFLYGSNNPELFSPDYLMTEDVVLVMINYRLGVLGFLSLNDPKLNVPGNAGLKDMVLALKWIQKNISTFNGDPQNVTIFGESAGSASVHYLCLSPTTTGLFHKAIAQSGCALNCWARGTTNGKLAADLSGYRGPNDETAILNHLTSLPVRKLISVQYKHMGSFKPSDQPKFGPVVEPPNPDAFLVEEPLELLKKGQFQKVPMMIGHTSREGLFFETVKKLRLAKWTSDLEDELPYDLGYEKGSVESKNAAEAIRKFYFGNEDPLKAHHDKVYLLKGDHHFTHGIHRTIRWHQKYSDNPIYLYRMNVDTRISYYKHFALAHSIHALFLCYFISYKFNDYERIRRFFLKVAEKLVSSRKVEGTTHGDDLGYLFPSFLTGSIEPDSQEDKTIRRFVRLWTNFARYGNPTPKEDNNPLLGVEWKPVDEDNLDAHLDIGDELKFHNEHPDKERIRFWDSIYGQKLN